MYRRIFISGTGGLCLATTAGCLSSIAGNNTKTVNAPAIVEDWEFSFSEISSNENISEGPNIECLSQDAVQITGRLFKGASDKVSITSMVHKRKTFKIIIGIEQRPGGEGISPTKYSINIQFNDRIPASVVATEQGSNNDTTSNSSCESNA